jgi:hypothetical protein
METYMKSNVSFSQWRACILGAVNGLLAGAVAYTALWLEMDYENQRIAEAELSGGPAMHLTLSIRWWGLPFFGLIAFTIASFLVHRYLASRVKSVVLLWQYVGAVAVVCGMLVMLITTWIGYHNGVTPSVYESFFSLSAVRTFLMAFAFVAVINLLYGAFIQMVVTLYSRRKKTAFP